jgi:hypothetical protein
VRPSCWPSSILLILILFPISWRWRVNIRVRLGARVGTCGKSPPLRLEPTGTPARPLAHRSLYVFLSAPSSLFCFGCRRLHARHPWKSTCVCLFKSRRQLAERNLVCGHRHLREDLFGEPRAPSTSLTTVRADLAGPSVDNCNYFGRRVRQGAGSRSPREIQGGLPKASTCGHICRRRSRALAVPHETLRPWLAHAGHDRRC